MKQLTLGSFREDERGKDFIRLIPTFIHPRAYFLKKKEKKLHHTHIKRNLTFTQEWLNSYLKIFLFYFFQRTERQVQQYYEEGRQSDSLVSTVIELALKYGPVLFNTFFGGDGGDAQKPIDKIDELDIKVLNLHNKNMVKNKWRERGPL